MRAWSSLLGAAVLTVAYLTLPTLALKTALWSALMCWPLIMIFIGIRRHRPAAIMPWVLIAVGHGMYAIGDTIYFLYENLTSEPVPQPSLADPFYLVWYPCVTVGVAVLARRRAPTGDRAGMLDALILTVGLALLSWTFVFGPTFGARDAPLFAIGYPLGDILILTATLRLGSGRGARSPSFRLLVAALMMMLCADIAYAWLVLNNSAVGTWVDLGYVSYGALLGAAVLHPTMRTLDQPAPAATNTISRGRFVLLLMMGSLLVPAVIMLSAATGRSVDLPVFAFAAAVLFGLVLLRMAGLVRAQRELQHDRVERRFQHLTEQVADVITVCDRNVMIQYQTPSVLRLLGYEPHQLVGTSIEALVHPDETGRIRALFAGSTDTEMIRPIECRLRHRDGHWVVTETIGRVVNQADMNGYLLTTRDITERRSLEDRLTEKALHDELTGLANRALLVDRVQHSLRRRGTLHRHLAVLVVDLDDFKMINDSLGRAVGDALLRTVADRLRGCLRAADTAARLGGDEFAMLLDDLEDAAEAATVAERVLAVMRQPVQLHDRTIVPRASVGIALADPDRVCDADELLRNADVAMHTAKRQGRNRYAYYAASMHAGLVEKLDLTADLRGAIERNELQVYYQPLVDLTTERIVGAEALVRWPHATHGMVPPDRFIPLAEESGLVLPLGYRVLDLACQQAAQWRKTTPITISVNLSPRQVQDPALTLYVQQALLRSGLPAEALTLEITESLLSEDAEIAAYRLGELKALGVRLAVDDFGTGYSSLSRLHEFPIDLLKIPKPFVDGVASGREQSALARAIVELSAALGLDVVAEGIEQAEQAEALRHLGCRLGQGFHFARPVPADQFDEMLREPAVT